MTHREKTMTAFISITSVILVTLGLVWSSAQKLQSIDDRSISNSEEVHNLENRIVKRLDRIENKIDKIRK